MKKINEIAREVEDSQIKFSQLSWVQYTTGIDLGVDEGYKDVVKLIKNKDYFKTIQNKMGEELGDTDARRVELMHKSFEPFHKSEEINALKLKIKKLKTKLSQRLNTFRCEFEGKKVTSIELRKIMSEDDDRQRRKKAFFATNQLNKPLVEEGFIELVKLRKQLAELDGKNDFVHMKLEEDELSPSIFDNWKNEVRKLLPEMKKIEKKYARKYLNDDEIMPWDYDYISGKIAPKLYSEVNINEYYEKLNEIFTTFDIPIDDYNITYDVFPRANKSEWGYNFTIQSGKDSRILANVKDRYSDYGVLLHETGHGIHSFMLKPYEILNRGVSGIISEGIANLFGSFLYEEIFYNKFFNVKDVKESFEDLKKWYKVTAIRAVHNILFDQGLYNNEVESLEDMTELYWKLYNELYDKAPFGENPPWAMRIHFTTHPIYLHNYFMGDITCEMLKSVFTKKHGVESITEKPKAFGTFLKKEVIEPSGRYKYNELFKRISGEEFSLKYLK